MSRKRVPAALRRLVHKRAGEHCEYCLLAEAHAFFSHEPDHIIALQVALASGLPRPGRQPVTRLSDKLT